MSAGRGTALSVTAREPEISEASRTSRLALGGGLHRRRRWGSQWCQPWFDGTAAEAELWRIGEDLMRKESTDLERGDQCFGAEAKRSFPPDFSNNLPFVMGMPSISRYGTLLCSPSGGVRRSRNLSESSKTLKCDRAASISKMRRRLSFDGSGRVPNAWFKPIRGLLYR